MPAIQTRTCSRAIRSTIVPLVAAVAVVILAGSPAPAGAAEIALFGASLCSVAPSPAGTLPAGLAAFEPVPTAGSTPACPAPVACPGVNTGYCTDTDLGPCCTSGGATLCCPAGTTLKVHQCIYTWVSGVVGRGICFGREVSCG